MVRKRIQLEGVLNDANRGLSLANEVVASVSAGDSVAIDFIRVSRMTPSFSNAFMMKMLEDIGVDSARKHVEFVNRNASVASSLSTSYGRWTRGVRLSSQRPALTH